MSNDDEDEEDDIEFDITQMVEVHEEDGEDVDNDDVDDDDNGAIVAVRKKKKHVILESDSDNPMKIVIDQLNIVSFCLIVTVELCI